MNDVGRAHRRTASLDAKTVALARSTSLGADRLLVLHEALSPLFPHGALERGTVVVVGPGPGSTSLALALLAGASASGSWCAVVGMSDPGVLAMRDLGLHLARLVIVPRPGPTWPGVVAALVHAADIVLLRPPTPVRPKVAQRLAGRVRERRMVLVVQNGPMRWPEDCDLWLRPAKGTWHGALEGHGHLQGRLMQVTADGRRSATHLVRVDLWLPDRSGTLSPPSPLSPPAVTPLAESPLPHTSFLCRE